MKYRLTVEQFETNPDYEAELKTYEERARWQHGCATMPQAERIVKVLSVEVTDVEFAAIKKATLETM